MPTFGWLRDIPKAPGDKPDHDAAPLLSSLPIPPSASNRELVVDVLDQGALGSCVANSILQAVRGSQVRQGAVAPKLGSRLFGYWVSRAYHHATDVDDGTYLRTFFQGLNQFGFCPESVYPYDVARYAAMPPSAAFRAGFDQHAPTVYKRIQSANAARVADIKRALAAGYLVTFGTLVSEDFARNQLGDAPLSAPIGKTIAGGHALCAVGYDGDDFEVVNSWSEDWGARGYCTMAADYLTWAETTDLWIVQEAPAYSE